MVTNAFGNPMCLMIRPKGKATQIAFSILGKPANMHFKRSEAQQKANKELVFQETSRER